MGPHQPRYLAASGSEKRCRSYKGILVYESSADEDVSAIRLDFDHVHFDNM